MTEACNTKHSTSTMADNFITPAFADADPIVPAAAPAIMAQSLGPNATFKQGTRQSMESELAPIATDSAAIRRRRPPPSPPPQQQQPDPSSRVQSSGASSTGSSLSISSGQSKKSSKGGKRKYSDQREQRNHHHHHHHQRRNSSDRNGKTGSKKKKKRRRFRRWILSKPRDLTQQQEQVFMTMKLRKLNRALTGTKTKRTRFELIVLVAYFVLALGVVSYTSGSISPAEEAAIEEETGTSRRIIVLDLGDIIIMMVYIFVVVMVTSFFRDSKFITLLYWMFIYLPLVFMIISFIVNDESADEYMGFNPTLITVLITFEIVVLVGFLTLYKLYPRLVTSAWFRRKSRAGIFWRIKVISDWTMTYVGQ